MKNRDKGHYLEDVTQGWLVLQVSHFLKLASKGLASGWPSTFTSCSKLFHLFNSHKLSGLVAHTWNHSTQEVESEDHKFKAIIGYLASSRPAWASWDYHLEKRKDKQKLIKLWVNSIRQKPIVAALWKATTPKIISYRVTFKRPQWLH